MIELVTSSSEPPSISLTIYVEAAEAGLHVRGWKLIEEGRASGEPPRYWAILYYGKKSLARDRDSFETGSPTGRTRRLLDLWSNVGNWAIKRGEKTKWKRERGKEGKNEGGRKKEEEVVVAAGCAESAGAGACYK